MLGTRNKRMCITPELSGVGLNELLGNERLLCGLDVFSRNAKTG
jgi:hypothetical protein